MSNHVTVETPHFVRRNTEVGDEFVKVSALHMPDRQEIFTNEGGDVTDAIVWHESWIENVYRLADGMLTGGTVVDLGANIGAFSTLCLAISENERVIAVEPTTGNRNLLNKNIALNGWEDRADVIGVAVGSEPGFCSMAANGGAAHVVKGTDVVVTTLGAIAGHLDEIDILKVDIEGAEWDLFKWESDAWSVLARARFLVMEWHQTDYAVLGRFLGMLAEYHSISGLIGKPETGGMLYSHRHDV